MQKIKYFLYTRKSSESEDRQVQSIDDQIDRLKDLADQFKLEIVDVFKESKSAKQPNNRPMFTEMIERLEKGEANGILCWQMNRLSRNPVDSGTLQWMLQKEIIQSIQTIDREYKPTDNAVIMSVESGVSNQFILDLSKNTKRGMQSRVDKGWMPNMAPLGYLNSKDDEGRGIIIEDPERFPLIRKMWDLMLTGNYSPTKIVRIANTEWGFHTRKMKRLGGKPMSESTIYRILNNRFYLGEISHRKEWHAGSHKPMVTHDEFARVQNLLGKKSPIRPKKHEFAFAGFIHCGECGCLVTVEKKQKYIKSTGEIRNYTYYHCTRKRKDITCSQTSCITEGDIDVQVETEIAKLTIDPDFRSWAVETLGQSHEKEVTKRSTIYQSLQEAANQTQSQLDNLTRMRIRDLIDDSEYSKQKDVLKAELAATRDELAKTENRADKWLEFTEQVFDFATYAHAAFINGTIQTKREIMSALGSNPTLLNGKLSIPKHPWFIPIENNASAINTEFARLEPKENSLLKSKNTSFSTDVSTWLRGWGSNPRPSR